MKSRDSLCDYARGGDTSAIYAVCNLFVAQVEAGGELDPAVLAYVAEQVDAQLSGVDRAHALGLPVRRRGRPSKLLTTIAGVDLALRHDATARRDFGLALACAERLLEGDALMTAYTMTAQLQGSNVSTVRRAWRRWSAIVKPVAAWDRNVRRGIYPPTPPEGSPATAPRKSRSPAGSPTTTARRGKSPSRRRVPRNSE